MSTKEAANAMAPEWHQGEHDLGPLAWVLGELRKSLEGAVKAMHRFVRDAEVARQSDLASLDASGLRAARQQLHQAAGALEMVGMDQPALVVRALEGAVQRFVQRPELCSDEASGVVEQASFALIEYLEHVLAGRAVSPVALFPQYRRAQELAGSERVHPADLWPVPRRVREPVLPQSMPAAAALAYGAQARARLDGAVLRIVKAAEPQAAAELRAISLAFAAAQHDAGVRSFWKISAGFFEALALGALVPDVYVKRVASRVLMQYASLARGETAVNDRLVQDMLFFCAQAAMAEPQAAPVLDAVRRANDLTGHGTVDYEQPRFGLYDPAVLAQARKRIAAATETWSALAGGDRNKLKLAVDQFGLVCDSLRRLQPGSTSLAQALTSAVAATMRSGEPPGTSLAIEVATAVLYLQASFEDLDMGQEEMTERAQDLAHRIDAVMAGGEPQPLELWMEELYGRVSERQTMGSVVGELRAALAEAEKAMDQHFRDPQDKAVLAPVPDGLQQMRGVLSVLGLDQASLAVLHMRTVVERLLVGDIPQEQRAAVFEKLGNNLGALGFLIDMLGYQRAMARKLFLYDEEQGELRILMGRARPETSREAVHEAAPAAEAEAAPASVPPSQAQAAAPGAVPAAVPTAPAPEASQPAVPPSPTVPAPAAPAPASPAAQPQIVVRDEQDQELLDIFLEEAREVVATGLEAIATLQGQPGDLSEQTTLRRAFHTLKGSSRMVGLNEFGEAAWAMEQTLNAWLAEQKPIQPALLALSAQALQAFGQWADAIAQEQAQSWQAQPFRAAADAMRLEGRLVDLHGAQPLSVPDAPQDEVVVQEAAPSAPAVQDEPAPDTPEPASEATLEPVLEPQQAASEPASPAPEPVLDFGFEFDLEPAPSPEAQAGAASGGQPEPEAEPAAAPTAELVPEPPLLLVPAAAPEPDILPQPSLPEAASLLEDALVQAVPEEPTPAEAVPELDADEPVRDFADTWIGSEPPSAEAVAQPQEQAPLAVGEEIDFAFFEKALQAMEAQPEPSVQPAQTAPALPPAEPDLQDTFFLAPQDAEVQLVLEPAEEAPAEAPQADDGMAAARPEAALDDAVALPPEAALSELLPESALPDLSPEPPLETSLEPPAPLMVAGLADLPAEQPPIQPPAETPVEPPADETKVIGDLRIGIPLYNVYLNEADEWSRHLVTSLQEWALELHRPVPDLAVALAHSLAGSSGTVGFTALSELARTLEHVLQHLQLLPGGSVEQGRIVNAAATDIRRLLHQFAAGFLKEPNAQVLVQLRELLQLEVTSAPSPLADELPPGLEQIAPDMPQAPDALAAHGPAPVQPAAAAPEVAVLWPTSSVLPDAEPRVDAAAGSAVPDEDDIDALDTIDPDLFPIFEEEAVELLPRLGGALRQWAARPDNLSARSELLRALHTLKGSARLAGAMRLGEMAHRMESAVEHIPSEGAQTSDIEPLLGRLDALQADFDNLRTIGAQPLTEAVTVAPQASAAESLPLPLSGADAQPAFPQPAVASAVQPSPTAAARAVPARASQAGQSVRVRSQLLDRLVNQAGEVMIARSRLEARMGQMRSSLNDLTGNLERLRQQLRDIEMQAESQMQSRLALSRDSAAGFDPLEFDRFTRVQELTRMMAESVNDVATVQRNMQRAMEGAEDDLIAQGRQARELQRDLLRTRMVEFESIAERLYAVVRQSSKEMAKQVKLDITGGAIEMDRGVLDRMTPVFEHLLRNCISHGIETPEQRQAAHKPAVGTITIGLRHEGNDVAVEFRDDGAGLNVERIRAKALGLGLIAPDARIGNVEAAQLIFQPGFSTASEVTALSGRGVGMDVVRTEVGALGGRVETETEAGQGTAFRMVLPLTTAVTQVVMLRAGTLVFGVPAALVELVRRSSDAQLEAAYASHTFEHGGEALPLHWAGALLQSSARSDEAGSKSRPVVILRSAAQRLAMHVDEVLGNQEVVVKNLGPQLSRLPGLAGMSVLASGAVVLIYNPVALANVYGEQLQAGTLAPLLHGDPRAAGIVAAGAGGAVPAAAAAAPLVPLVLVVDDSITVRRVTQRLLVREGYRVALAADGLQALERLQEERPAVVLSDIEMPRMDGFDLARNIRGDAALQDLPIIMITSRIAEKHREHAMELGVNHYLGKPYSDEELLGLVQHYTRQQAAAQPA